MKPYTLHIISHTHWDREWYLNSPYVNEWLVPFFDSLFAMMEKEKEYRFVLDGQASMIDDWFDELDKQGRNREEAAALLKKYAGQGRILVGPYYLQLDWNLSSPETLVRNLLLGMEAVSAYGTPMPVGWLLDNFGQTAQTAQIHAGFGIDSIFMWRGAEVDSRSLKTEFWWESPDSTKSLTVLLLGSYRNAMRLGAYSEVAARRLVWEKRKLSAFTTTPNAVLMNGYDQETEPDDILGTLRICPPLDGIQAVQSTPAEYVQSVRDCSPDLVTRSGSLYGGRYIAVFPGVLSARTYLKTRNDQVASLLEQRAEPVAAACALLGKVPEILPGLLDRAWKQLLRNQPHDSICGVSVDPVHTDMEARFDHAEKLATEALGLGTIALFSGVASPTDTPVWSVFNPLPRPRAALAEFELAEGLDATRYTFVDSHGTMLAAESGRGRRVRVFLPALAGFATESVRAVPGASRASPEGTHVHTDPATLSMGNGLFNVKTNRDGSFDLFDSKGTIVFQGQGYLIDEGDAGDEYDYSACIRQTAVDSRAFPHTIKFEETGALRSVIRISCVMKVPAALSSDRSGRSTKMVELPVVVRLVAEAGARSVGIRVDCRNSARDHRLRMHFPAGSESCKILAGSAFCREEVSPAAADYSESDLSKEAAKIVIGARAAKPVGMRPLRDFATLASHGQRLDLFADGLHEMEALPSGGMAVTLVRCMAWLARADLTSRIGDAGPLMLTPDAQCLRDLTFTLGLACRAGSDSNAPVDAAQERRWLPIVTMTSSGLATRTKDMGLELVAGGDRLFVSALKPAADGNGIILRLWNPEEAEITASLRLPQNIHSVCLSSLAETVGLELNIDTGNMAHFSALPGKIITLRIFPKSNNRTTTQTSPSVPPLRLETKAILPPPNFSAWPLPAPATKADLLSETTRADEVEAEWKIVMAQLEEARRQNQNNLEIRKLNLAEASIRRTSIEARISAVLLRRHVVAGWTEETERDELRKLSYALNLARVDKRALEYVVECLENSEE